MDISKQSMERIEWLNSMSKAAQFEAIAMNIENPQIFSQFMALDDSAEVYDYAYAAGLITKPEADYAMGRTSGDTWTVTFRWRPDYDYDDYVVKVKKGESVSWRIDIDTEFDRFLINDVLVLFDNGGPDYWYADDDYLDGHNGTFTPVANTILQAQQETQEG